MIDVIVAEGRRQFRRVLINALAATDDFRILGWPQSSEELVNMLTHANPHLLLMSTSFLPVFLRIQHSLLQRHTALLVLAEENDPVAYGRWLRAQGVLYRSMDGSAVVEAMRRVARGESFIQKRSSDRREKRILYVCYDPTVLVSRERLLQDMGYQVCAVLGQDGLQALKDDSPFDLALIGDEGSLAQQQRAARLLKELYPHASIITISHSFEKVTGTDYYISATDAAWPPSGADGSRRQVRTYLGKLL
jgi:CheY-like chemotaxis protein